MLGESDIAALFITLRLALVTTLILMLVGLPLAWWLAHSRRRLKIIVEALVAVPLVLPPTVLGFYLLVALGPEGPLGGLMSSVGMQSPVFTFWGLVVGSVVFSLPFVVQPLQNAFVAVGKGPLETAATLGAGPWDRFRTVALPQARPGVITAAVLGFAHTVGEFGVVLMIGGNIPGRTQVLSIAIYDHVEALDYAAAHWLSAGLLAFSFALLMVVFAINRRFRMVT